MKIIQIIQIIQIIKIIKTFHLQIMIYIDADVLNEGGSGAGAGEAVDGERGARPRDEEVAPAAEGVGGAGEGEQQFFSKQHKE